MLSDAHGVVIERDEVKGIFGGGEGRGLLPGKAKADGNSGEEHAGEEYEGVVEGEDDGV